MSTHQRPLLFSSALVLSTIGSGLALLLYLFSFLFFDQALALIEQYTNLISPTLISRLYVLAFAAAYLVSFIGIIKLWQGRKLGFYLYLLAQITIWGLPMLVIGWQAFSSTNTIFTLLFLAIYSVFLKLLK